jgi:hypothetical protein
MIGYVTPGWDDDDTWRQEYFDGRSRTLLGFELPPRMRRLLHSYDAQAGIDHGSIPPLSSADSDHLLEVNSISYSSPLEPPVFCGGGCALC